MQPLPDSALAVALLESLVDPVLFVDTEHRIRYMNAAAERHYSQGRALLDRSIFDCHNEESNRVIREVFAALCAGETERRITNNEKQQIFMRAVRDATGRLLGYYERYAPPGN